MVTSRPPCIIYVLHSNIRGVKVHTSNKLSLSVCIYLLINKTRIVLPAFTDKHSLLVVVCFTEPQQWQH
jgi:hypothetical protein